MEPGDLLGNVRRAVAFEKDRQFAQLGRPVDRQEWLDTPQTVDAYYNHTLNEIVFPAAILSPPLFSLEADDAQNYGGIGAMIGHEIGHGFDDQGCKYDSQGNLRDWWTEADRREFGRLTSRLVDQYDDIRPPETPGAHINGELTLGENIGDLGGLAIAHKAYLLSVDSAQDPDLSRSGSQLLFTSWARMWCSKFRPAELARRMVIDLHAPSRYRCNQVARNLLEFHQAFGVKPGDGMWLEPDQRVRIW
jgi:putative endopeptidase